MLIYTIPYLLFLHMQKITYHEHRRLGVELHDGSRFTFAKEKAHPHLEPTYRLALDGVASKDQCFEHLPTLEDMRAFLNELATDIADNDLTAMRVQMAV